MKKGLPYTYNDKAIVIAILAKHIIILNYTIIAIHKV